LAALVVCCVNTNRLFPEFFAKACEKPKMVSSGCHFVSSACLERNNRAHALKTRETRKGFNGRPKISVLPGWNGTIGAGGRLRTSETGHRLAGAAGAE
jgi:hypothetical protein